MRALLAAGMLAASPASFGQFNLYVRHAAGDVVVAATALSSMSIVGNTAIVIGKAKINGSGDYNMQAIITDVGEPGIGRDRFGLQAGTVSFAPTAIMGGNIQVH